MINKMITLNKEKHRLIGASLIRIGFSLIIIYNYAIHYSQRHFLWGSNGVIGYPDNSIFSLYYYNHSVLYFDVIYHLGLIIAIVFLFGYKGRITAILNFIFTWSLVTVNGVISDGGDNISRILLFYLLFANTTAYLSVDAYLRKKPTSRKNIVKKIDNNQLSLGNLVHNLAILACLVQVCILYFTSGLHKAMGELWQSGTALYYILQVEEFTHPFFRDIILSSDILIVTGTYMAIIAQLAFPFLVFNRYTKYIAMASLISLHLGIAIVMGLYTFSAIMILNQLLFLSDKEYTSLKSYFKQTYSKISDKLKIKKRVITSGSPASNLRSIIVFYDGWCPLCKKSIKTFQRLDWLNRVKFKSFREKNVLDHYCLDKNKLEKRMHSIRTFDNKLEDGIYSINRICKNTPILWIFVPFLSFFSILGLGQRIYDWIANRRTIFPTGNCDENNCEIFVNTSDK